MQTRWLVAPALMALALAGCASRSLPIPLATADHGGGDMATAAGCHCVAAPPCGFDGTCDDAGHCNYAPSTTMCAPASCSGGVVTAGSFCDGAGTCQPAVPTQCKAPAHAHASCDGDACAFACDDGYGKSGTSCVPRWTAIATNTTFTLTAIAGTGAGDIYIAGYATSDDGMGYIFHSSDGVDFGFTPPVTRLGLGIPNQIVVQGARTFVGGVSSTEVGDLSDWVVSSGGVTGPWTPIASQIRWDVYSLWAASGSDSTVIAGGMGNRGNGLYAGAVSVYQDGAVAASYVLPQADDIRSVWASSSSDVYIVMYTSPLYSIWHTTTPEIATSWTQLTVDDPLWATAQPLRMWGSSASDIYVVGTDGLIEHSTGDGRFSGQASGVRSTNLIGVWGSGPNDVYAVGTSGTILHSTGDGIWTPQQSPTTAVLYQVWGAGADDVYIVGAAGTLLHKK